MFSYLQYISLEQQIAFNLKTYCIDIYFNTKKLRFMGQHQSMSCLSINNCRWDDLAPSSQHDRSIQITSNIKSTNYHNKIMYRNIKLDDRMFLGKNYLIRHIETDEYFTLKYYSSLDNEKLVSQMKKYMAALMRSQWHKNCSNNFDYAINVIAVWGNDQEMQGGSVSNQFNCIPSDYLAVNCMQTPSSYSSLDGVDYTCKSTLMKQFNLVLDCVQVDLDMISNHKGFEQFQEQQIIHIMKCVIEGIQFLHYYDIRVYPICSSTIFMGTTKEQFNDEDLTAVNFKVIPAFMAQRLCHKKQKLAMEQLIFPPELTNQNNLLYPYSIKNHTIDTLEFTFQHHVYCLGITMLNLMIDQVIKKREKQTNKEGVNSYFLYANLDLRFLKAEEKISQLMKQGIDYNLLNLLGSMIQAQPQKRTGITCLLTQLEDIKTTAKSPYRLENIQQIKNQPKTARIDNPTKDNTHTDTWMSATEFVKSSRSNNQLNLQNIRKKYKKSSHKLSSISRKNPPNYKKAKINNNKDFASKKQTQRGMVQTINIDLSNPQKQQKQRDPLSQIEQNKIYKRIKFNDSTIYEGQVKGQNTRQQYEPQGLGTLFHEDGSILYSGYWIRGKFHGFGYVYNKNLDDSWKYYEGQFKDNKKNGQGTIHYRNSQKFQGHFIDDKKTGNGNFYNKDREIIKGYWQNDILKQIYF